MEQARAYFNSLNDEYLAVHRKKEDLFWDVRMALSSDQGAFSNAEQEYKDFVSDPARLQAVRAQLESVKAGRNDVDKGDLEHGLRGWQAFFESNIVDNDAAAARMRELIEMEAALYGRRRQFKMSHLNEQGEAEEASLGALSTNIAVNPNEAARKSSHDELRRLERWVLENGLLEIVGKRNEFARALGYRDYFDYKVNKNENMSPERLFEILGDFESQTREANRRSLDQLAADKGEGALRPYNIAYYTMGDLRRQLDAYLPFGLALRRWVESFRRMGITFRGAVMQLDLLDREGKWENGFCHGPVPCYFDANGVWVAGQINFTSNARPDQVGSGSGALATLFHEGGHAAHFANVAQNSPCFSQEYPPTSMAYAETQSMFCDSVLADADWLKRYAVNAAGEVIPDELVRSLVEVRQPWRARTERALLAVPYFEVALYKMADAERTADAVLDLARSTERTIFGIEGTRPLLSVPHLLDQESSAAYHGYLLAHMAVYQTRAYFQRTHGYLTDNPAIGPLLATHYWAPGNSVDHDTTLRSLTGEGFSAKYLAADCNRSVDEAWDEARASMEAAQTRVYPTDYPDSLDATLRIVDGAEVIADNGVSEEAMCTAFEAWVGKRYF